MAERSWSPIPGYCGHVPGRRWQVGKASSKHEVVKRSDSAGIVTERMEISHEPRMSPLHKGRENLATGMASIPRVSSPQSEDFNASFISEATQTDDFDDPQLGASSRAARSELQSPQMLLRAPSRESPRSQNRSKSAPRKVKPGRNAGVNMFSGLEAGWWSKSDAIKNCERHRQHLEQKKLGVKAAKSGYGHTNHSAHRAFSSNPQDDEDFTPCAGYSGHLPGFRHHDVGKSFCAAAKESRRDRFDHSFRSSS